MYKRLSDMCTIKCIVQTYANTYQVPNASPPCSGFGFNSFRSHPRSLSPAPGQLPPQQCRQGLAMPRAQDLVATQQEAAVLPRDWWRATARDQVGQLGCENRYEAWVEDDPSHLAVVNSWDTTQEQQTKAIAVIQSHTGL
mmetsp:Transcript_17397/g.29560  ORF Transcript_17397/g.29560 Transcript_17397/m.29560 type:complete len:140 (-) Transcript_17397:575-994(-)